MLIGNQLNFGYSDQNVYALGFHLSSLSKLGHTKPFFGKTTLLHYVVKIIEKEIPESLDFGNQMSHLDGACKISISQIKLELQDLDAGLKKVVGEIKCDDDGCMSTFGNNAIEDLNDIKNEFDLLQSKVFILF